mmetsp:Transcript_8770/g.17900  ORF Transcript_8770/g.17900 Transcript_8770/m.17900 type:complete len:476 (-) Transcript_8770:1994-3421(-)
MLNSTDLIPIMKRRLKEVTEVLDVPPSAAAALMRENKWAKERLFETFYNDPDKILKSCGVLERVHRKQQDDGDKKPPAAAAAAAAATRTTRSKKKRECGICYDEDGFSPDEMFSMPCGHEFCRDCWRGFLDVALTNGPVCIRQTCPEAGCKEIVTEEEYEELAPGRLPQFQTFQLRNFVECYGMTRWCPGPGCERVAVGNRQLTENATTGGLVAECDTCDTVFCLQCGEEPHAPADCKELAAWNEKCKNESETANWILANTKSCPKCSTRIEKNQGCNHMTCQSCRYEFCWICMGNWSDHGANTGGYYRCNKFDANDDPANQSDAAKAKRELDRYLHYYKRYHAHSEAEKFARKQLKETEARMVLLQEQSENSLWTDVEFLKAANQQLVECRRCLKYTYTFAYYMSTDKDDADAKSRKERFEYHQEMLERFTENLSEISEKPLDQMDRTDVVNQTRVVDRFMKNILKYVDDGLEE